MNDVGRNIRNLRRKQGISQEALAGRLYVTRQAVSQWENGRTQPDLKTLDEIAGFFGVDILAIIYGERRKADAVAPHRKKYKKGLVLFGVLSLGMLLLVLLLRSTVMDMYYRFIAETFVRFYLACAEPLLYLFVALFAANGVSLGWDLHIRARTARLSVFAASIALLACYGIVPLLATFGISVGNPVLQRVWMFFQTTPVLFLLPGLGLHFGRKVVPKA